MGRLSLNGKRVLSAITLAIFLFCLTNYYLELGIFGHFARKVLIVSVVALVIAALYLQPTPEQVEEYRAKKMSK